MKCKEFLERIHDGVDGELGGAEAAQFRGHAGSCTSCGARAEAVRRIKKLVQVKARTEVAPAGLERLVRERLEAEPGVYTLPMRLWAAAAMVIICLGAFLVVRPFDAHPPEIAHAQAIEEALELTQQEADKSPSGLEEYTARLLDAVPNAGLLADNDMELLGWSEETIGEEEIPAVRIRIRWKDSELSCFAFRAHLVACPTSDDHHGDEPEAPAGVCMCKVSEDGKTVICYQLPQCEGVHMITVLHPELSAILSDDTTEHLKNVLVSK